MKRAIYTSTTGDLDEDETEREYDLNKFDRILFKIKADKYEIENEDGSYYEELGFFYIIEGYIEIPYQEHDNKFVIFRSFDKEEFEKEKEYIINILKENNVISTYGREESEQACKS